MGILKKIFNVFNAKANNDVLKKERDLLKYDTSINNNDVGTKSDVLTSSISPLKDNVRRKNNINGMKSSYKSTKSSIEPGSLLYAQNGEVVVVNLVQENYFTVNYKNKEYRRTYDILGKKLFYHKPTLVLNKFNNSEKTLKMKEEENIESKQPETHTQEKIKNRQEALLGKREEEKIARENYLKKMRREETELRESQRRVDEAEKKKKKERIREAFEEGKQKEREKELKEKARNEKLKKYNNWIGSVGKKDIYVYHDVFGEGKVERINNENTYIYIDFASEKEQKIFSYPEALDVHIHIGKTDKLKARDEFLAISTNAKNNEEEKNYFDKVINFVEKKVKEVDGKVDCANALFNDFSDSYDSSAFAQRSSALKERKLWGDIRRSPYFARLDYDSNNKIYIGKNAVPNHVVDWREKIAILYYKYEMYINSEEYSIDLIRDFDIVAGRYCGYKDKYSESATTDNIEINSCISDEFLLHIIEENRRNQVAYDIIQTIQKNQYEIITQDSDQNILVQGCAGSGKTMILFHRLSYMFFHSSGDNQIEYYVVSPTKLLNLEEDALAKSLQLNRVKRLSTRDFYIDLLNQYSKENSIQQMLNGDDYRGNYTVDSEFVSEIYSVEYQLIIVDNVESLLNRTGNIYEQLIQHEYDVLTKTFEEFEISNFKDFDISKKLSIIEEKVSRLPYENVYEKLKKIKTDSDINIRKRKVLTCLLGNWQLNEKAKYTSNNNDKEQKIYLGDDLFREVFEIFDAMSKGSNSNNWNLIREKGDIQKRYDDSITYFTMYKEASEKYNLLNEYAAGESQTYLSNLIDTYIWLVKHENDIDTGNNYDFELYIKLIYCYTILGSLKNKKCIFIDEFQDFALAEIKLFQAVLQKSIFNLYGDLKQNINPKGITYNEINKLEMNGWQKHMINENYRNAHQITNFVNEEFKLKILPIGLKGQVIQVKLNSLKAKDFNYNGRTVIIAKGTSDKIFMSELNRIFEEINVIDEEHIEIKIDTVNVLPVYYAKGLEFDNVFVYQKDMSENERYVAYTRALSRLIILE